MDENVCKEHTELAYCSRQGIFASYFKSSGWRKVLITSLVSRDVINSLKLDEQKFRPITSALFSNKKKEQ